jgi:predicted metalloprotease with PDZ domain
MQNMLNKALVEKRPFDKNWFIDEVKTLLGIDISKEIQLYIIDGQTIPVSVMNEVLTFPLEIRPTKVFDLGYTFVKNEEGKTFVTSLTVGSGAEMAGIQVGQQIVGYSIYGSANELSSITILEGDKRREIPFYPYILKDIPQHK